MIGKHSRQVEHQIIQINSIVVCWSHNVQNRYAFENTWTYIQCQLSFHCINCYPVTNMSLEHWNTYEKEGDAEKIGPRNSRPNRHLEMAWRRRDVAKHQNMDHWKIRHDEPRNPVIILYDVADPKRPKKMALKIVSHGVHDKLNEFWRELRNHGMMFYTRNDPSWCHKSQLSQEDDFAICRLCKLQIWIFLTTLPSSSCWKCSRSRTTDK